MNVKENEPAWLTSSIIRIMHAESLSLFGGSSGIRDENLLESAITRAKNKYLYNPECNLYDLAASYAYGLIRNHAFVDGNKRIALLSIRLFLFLNGIHFIPDHIEAVTVMEDLAADIMSEDTLSRWIMENCSPL